MTLTVFVFSSRHSRMWAASEALASALKAAGVRVRLMDRQSAVVDDLLLVIRAAAMTNEYVVVGDGSCTEIHARWTELPTVHTIQRALAEIQQAKD